MSQLPIPSDKGTNRLTRWGAQATKIIKASSTAVQPAATTDTVVYGPDGKPVPMIYDALGNPDYAAMSQWFLHHPQAYGGLVPKREPAQEGNTTHNYGDHKTEIHVHHHHAAPVPVATATTPLTPAEPIRRKKKKSVERRALEASGRASWWMMKQMVRMLRQQQQQPQQPQVHIVHHTGDWTGPLVFLAVAFIALIILAAFSHHEVFVMPRYY